jgi:hypothetical protein
MRLQKLDHGHTLRQKLILRMIRIVSRDPAQPLDIIKTMMYRPSYFGKRASNFYDELLRGPSQWSVGERELFAAFTSSLNACRF